MKNVLRSLRFDVTPFVKIIPMNLKNRLIAACIAITMIFAVSLISSLSSYNHVSNIVNSFISTNVPKKEVVAFCVLAKDELDIYEWVDYHRQLGVSKFYVYDEYSDPPMSVPLKGFIDSGT